MSGISAFRSQFQNADEETSRYNQGGNMTYLSVDEGFNDFRLFPSTIEGDSFVYLRHVFKLEVEVENDGKKEVKKKHIFNSRTHGGTPKDIVDVYREIFEERARQALLQQQLSDKEFKSELKKQLAVINDWREGISPEFKWVGYAIKLQYSSQPPIREVKADRGTIDFAFSVGKKMDALAASFDRRGSVATVDPFTDPESGGILVINYDKKRDPADMYQVSLDTNLSRPLTAEDMEWLKNQRTLREQYFKSYTRKDFNMAVEGLSRFDQKHRIGLFQDPSFQAAIEEISGYYPAEENIPIRDMATNTATPFANVPQEQPPQDKPSVQQTHRHQETVSSGSRHESGTIHSGGSSFKPQASEKQAPASDTEERPAQNLAEAERQQLISYIQHKGLPITVHPQHTNQQIREFIEQEEQLASQDSSRQADNKPSDEKGSENRAQGGAGVVKDLF